MPLKHTLIFLLVYVVAFSDVGAQQNTIQPGVREISISLSRMPDTVFVEKTRLRYNKRFAMSFHADDGLADVFSVGFRFFTGINGPSTNYPGLFFTDGCGNDVSFKISSALFSFSTYNKEDMHRPGNNYNTVTWPQLDTMYRNGCGIYNHGFTSDAPTDHQQILYSIRRNESYIRRSLASTTKGGVKTRVLVNPNGLAEYSPVAFSLGYRYTFRMGAWKFMPENGMNVSAFTMWDKPLEINRVLAETINVKQLADHLRARSINGANYWMPVFTHRIIEDYPLNAFLDDWNYIAKTYGKTGSDDIWMASEEEILNYLLVRQRVELQHELKSNTLFIKLSGHLPPDLRFYPLTLLVHTPGASITAVNISGGKSHTYGPTGSDKILINLNWDGNMEPDLMEVAEQAVKYAERNGKAENALVAMDYVKALPDGRAKDAMRRRLCSMRGFDFEPGFCIIPAR
ncbi:MAG TPA: hypothetical protein PKE03_08530 [Bacteroidales bacterium]|nr:hypothetical protein [Bacteroidales bacterium]